MKLQRKPQSGGLGAGRSQARQEVQAAVPREHGGSALPCTTPSMLLPSCHSPALCFYNKRWSSKQNVSLSSLSHSSKCIDPDKGGFITSDEVVGQTHRGRPGLDWHLKWVAVVGSRAVLEDRALSLWPQITHPCVATHPASPLVRPPLWPPLRTGAPGSVIPPWAQRRWGRRWALAAVMMSSTPHSSRATCRARALQPGCGRPPTSYCSGPPTPPLLRHCTQDPQGFPAGVLLLCTPP